MSYVSKLVESCKNIRDSFVVYIKVDSFMARFLSSKLLLLKVMRWSVFRDVYCLFAVSLCVNGSLAVLLCVGNLLVGFILYESVFGELP